MLGVCSCITSHSPHSHPEAGFCVVSFSLQLRKFHRECVMDIHAGLFPVPPRASGSPTCSLSCSWEDTPLNSERPGSPTLEVFYVGAVSEPATISSRCLVLQRSVRCTPGQQRDFVHGPLLSEVANALPPHHQGLPFCQVTLSHSTKR